MVGRSASSRLQPVCRAREAAGTRRRVLPGQQNFFSRFACANLQCSSTATSHNLTSNLTANLIPVPLTHGGRERQKEKKQKQKTAENSHKWRRSRRPRCWRAVCQRAWSWRARTSTARCRFLTTTKMKKKKKNEEEEEEED